MTLFYLVRHGETDWNREQVFRGRLDVALNDRGRRQAQAAAERLAEVGPAGLYSSPLARARETAEAIAQRCSVECRVEEAFIDIDFGRWQGLTLREVQARFPEDYRTYREAPGRLQVPGGEPLGAVRERAVEAVRRLAEEFPDAAVCVVSHRVVCKLVMAWALGLEEGAFWRLRQDTACINLFAYDGRQPVVHSLNDTCHLRGLADGESRADF